MRDESTRIIESWNEKAAIYSKQRKISEADFLVLDILEKAPHEKILEIGAGSGIIAKKMFDRFGESISHYTDLDASQEFINIARKRLKKYGTCTRIEFICLPMNDYDYPIEKYDAVIAMSVIHHVRRKSIRKLVQSIYRALRENGIFILLEDWAETPKTGTEQDLYTLRKIYGNKGESEYHQHWKYYCDVLKSIGFSHISRKTPRRNIDLEFFDGIKEIEDARRIISRLNKHVRLESRMTLITGIKTNI